ncbi:MAG: DNA glycosylase AlkZ-like family protein [Nocardioidaceae bacterium]
MGKPYTWGGLRTLSLPRQFPAVRGRGAAGVVELMRRVGPVQAQAPRAPFVTVSSRLPGATYVDVTNAHESFELVRSTSLRGTVHTSGRSEHPWLHAVAARAQAGFWRRTLKLTASQLEEFWAEIELSTESGWRTHEELREHMLEWFGARGLEESIRAAATQAATFSYRGHGAMCCAGRFEAAGINAAKWATAPRRTSPTSTASIRTWRWSS